MTLDWFVVYLLCFSQLCCFIASSEDEWIISPVASIRKSTGQWPTLNCCESSDPNFDWNIYHNRHKNGKWHWIVVISLSGVSANSPPLPAKVYLLSTTIRECLIYIYAMWIRPLWNAMEGKIDKESFSGCWLVFQYLSKSLWSIWAFLDL